MEDHQTLQTWKTGQRTRSMHVRRASTTKSTTRSPSLPQKQRNPSTKPVNGGSKWQELRHSVRIKATLDTEQIRPKNARIADLCDEDREKVAKLIRRIVDVGAMHEEVVAEAKREKEDLQVQINSLNEQKDRDAKELEELSEKLKSTLIKLSDYQERVLVLEEANEVESKNRLETDQMMDQLKMEVEKLKKLVRKQKNEAEQQQKALEAKYKQENVALEKSLKKAQEELIQEKKERLLEKQQELEKKIKQSTFLNRSQGEQKEDEKENEQTPTESASSSSPLDMSIFFNSTTNLPEPMRAVMEEWKRKMEEAAAAAAAIAVANGQTTQPSKERESTIAACTSCKQSTSPTKKQDIESSPSTKRRQSLKQSPINSSRQQQIASEVTHRSPIKTSSARTMFDALLIPKVQRKPFNLDTDNDDDVEEEKEEVRPSRSPVSPETSRRHSVSPKLKSPKATELPRRSNTYTTANNRINNGRLQKQGRHTPKETVDDLVEPFDMSLFEIVDELEENGHLEMKNRSSSKVLRSFSFISAPKQNITTEKRSFATSGSRIESLMKGLARREKRLAAFSTHSPTSTSKRKSIRSPLLDEALSIINDVQEIYSEEHQHHHDDVLDDLIIDRSTTTRRLDFDDSLGPALSARDLSVREAVEKDMQELLDQI